MKERERGIEIGLINIQYLRLPPSIKVYMGGYTKTIGNNGTTTTCSNEDVSSSFL